MGIIAEGESRLAHVDCFSGLLLEQRLNAEQVGSSLGDVERWELQDAGATVNVKDIPGDDALANHGNRAADSG